MAWAHAAHSRARYRFAGRTTPHHVTVRRARAGRVATLCVGPQSSPHRTPYVLERVNAAATTGRRVIAAAARRCAPCSFGLRQRCRRQYPSTRIASAVRAHRSIAP